MEVGNQFGDCTSYVLPFVEGVVVVETNVTYIDKLQTERHHAGSLSGRSYCGDIRASQATSPPV
jgi:hypothetical protein